MNERIKKVRKTSGLTQEAFGQRIETTKASVSRLESGEYSPSNQTIKLICQEFGVSREWLVDGSGPMYMEQVPDGPGALVPELMAALQGRPALLEAMKKAVRHMRPNDWDRLNQLLDDIQKGGEKP